VTGEGDTMPAGADVKQRYQDALDQFVEKVEKDSHILAAILFGSLSYDEVWEQSDIDMYLVSSDEKLRRTGFSLVENDVNIHVVIYPRQQFKKMLEGSLQSSFFHASFAKSTLLFSRDETISEYYEDKNRLGSRDRDIQLMKAAAWVMPNLAKAEKFFHVKRDMHYSFLWTMHVVEGLARIETLQNGEVVQREVIHQALRHNPSFFNAIYTDLIEGPKDESTMGKALEAIDDYLMDRVGDIYKPLLDFLVEEQGARTSTEITERFQKVAQTGEISMACEWLADRDVVDKVSAPVRLTKNSQVSMEEAAYYYDEEMAL
jgi:uncharacterized protein